MQLSVSTEYAIHSVLYLAMHSDRNVILVGEIAKAQNIPGSYLAKVFRILAKAGVIRSFRGSKGGYSLGRPPDNVTLEEVVEAIEGHTPLFQSLGMRRGCKAGALCKLQETFQTAEKHLYQDLEQVTIQDLMDYAIKNADNMGWLMQDVPKIRDRK